MRGARTLEVSKSLRRAVQYVLLHFAVALFRREGVLLQEFRIRFPWLAELYLVDTGNPLGSHQASPFTRRV